MDNRFDVPLYTIAEAAGHLSVPPSTLRTWVRDQKIVHALEPETPHGPTLPFIAMAEAQFCREFRRAGLSMRAIREGVVALRAKLGEYILVKDRLAHDGVDVLVDLGTRTDDPEWTRARDRQGGLHGVIEVGVEPITWADDSYPQRLTLTAYEGADVIVDPRFGFGQPMLADRGVRVEDIAQLFLAGDDIETVSDEFGVDPAAVQAIVRAYARRAA